VAPSDFLQRRFDPPTLIFILRFALLGVRLRGGYPQQQSAA
jgi:hypothetical protein